MTLNCSVVKVTCVVTKGLKLQLRGFRYKIALYLSYLHIEFDDEINGNLFRFQAQFLITLRPTLN